MSDKNRQLIRLACAVMLTLTVAHTATAQALRVWGVPTAIVDGVSIPLSVTVDSKGNIIYADTGNRRVIAARPDSSTLATVGTGAECGSSEPSDEPEGIRRPLDCFSEVTSVAVDSSGLVYVTDYGNSRVIVLDSLDSSLPLRPLYSFGTRGGPFGTGIATGIGHNDPIAWNPDGSSGVGAPDQFQGPYSIAIDRGQARNVANVNHVYVLDFWNNRIAAWDCDQSKLRLPTPPADACHPNAALSFGDNGLYFSDPPSPYFNFPQGFGVDQATGDIGVAETNALTVDLFRYPFTGPKWGWAGTIGSAYDPSSTLLLPFDVKFDGSGNLWVVDQGNNSVQIFSQSSFSPIYQPIGGAGLFDHDGHALGLGAPQTIALDPARNRVVIADQGNNRLEIWQPASLDAALTFDNAAPLSGAPATATLTITNTGAVPLTNLHADISTSAGLTVLPFTLPQSTLSACTSPPCPSVSFQVPFKVNGIDAVRATADVTGDHEFSSARIVAPTASATVTPGACAMGIGIAAVSVTPNPVQSGGTVTLSGTLQNIGKVPVTNVSIAMTPTGATCQSCAAPTVATLAPGASFHWSSQYVAADSGVAHFVVTASATAQPSGTVATATWSGSTEIRSDITVPVTIVSYSSPYQAGPNANGFWNRPVIVSFTATDPEGITQICYTITPQPPGPVTTCLASGVTPAPPSFKVSLPPIWDDGLYTFTFYAIDPNGNSGASAQGTSSFKLDRTPAYVSFSLPSPLPNVHGWYKSLMTWTVAASDNFSGVESVTYGGAPLTMSTIVLNTAGACVQGTVIVTDRAGNTSVQSSPCTNIDLTKPTMTPLTLNGIVTFPIADTGQPNGLGDPAPPAVTLPAGMSVGAYQSSGLDPSTLPPAAGIPIASGTISWTLCDLAGNCNQAFLSAATETVNQFDLVHHVDALYARSGPTGYLPKPLVPKPPTHNNARSHHWGGYDQGQWRGHGDSRWSDDDHDDRDDCDVTTYELLDANGNGMVMVEHIQKSSGTEMHVGVVAFYYMKGCPANCVKTPGVVPPGTTKNFEWSLDRKTGAYKEFEQEFTIGRDEKRIVVSAKYDAKKNQTTIRREGWKMIDVTLPGMVLLDMATKDGQLFIEYNGVRVTN